MRTFLSALLVSLSPSLNAIRLETEKAQLRRATIMYGLTRKYSLYLLELTVLMTFAALANLAQPQPGSSPSQVTAPQTGCTPEQRREALRALQTQVLQVAPRQLDALKKALAPGGPLAGWRLAHGLVVLATAGAVGVDNIEAKDPMPQLLLYAPSPSSSPADWLDFDGSDGPYRLVGWAYIAPYQPGSAPPSRKCVAASEWFVHEAGWHLMDGNMLLTPGATAEPPRPQLKVGIHLWHPQVWDIHYWIGDDGVPTISFANPKAPGGGLHLPEDSFFYLVNGRKQPPPKP
jgi:hypothetical protein